MRKWVCNRCGVETSVQPAYRNETCPVCRRGRRRIHVECGQCGHWFLPEYISAKYCSKPCKDRALATGRKVLRMATTQARSARSLLAYHVNAGNIIKSDSCEECSRTGCAIEAAHYNYEQPLRVRWLCRPCHRRWDREQPKGGSYVVFTPGGVEEKLTGQKAVRHHGYA